MLRTLFFVFFLTNLFLSLGCKKTVQVAPVSTPNVSIKMLPGHYASMDKVNLTLALTRTSSQIPVSEIGICWEENDTPTVNSNKKWVSYYHSDTIPFVFNGLTMNTYYNVRGYCISETKVYYTPMIRIKTHELTSIWTKSFLPNPGSFSVVDVIKNPASSFSVLSRVALNQYSTTITGIDTAGNLLWSNNFLNRDPTAFVRVDDGYIISAKQFVPGGSKVFLIKTDLNGLLVWEKDLSRDNFQNHLQMHLNNANNISLTTMVYNGISPQGELVNCFIHDFILAGTNGQILNESSYPNVNVYAVVGPGHCGRDIAFSDGSFLIAYNFTPLGVGYTRTIVQRFSSTRQIAWETIFPPVGSNEFAYKVIENNGGTIVLTTRGAIPNESINNTTLLTQVDNARGNILWRAMFRGAVGSIIDNFPESIKRSPDNHFYITGLMNNRYPYLLKIDNTGNIIWDYPITNIGYANARGQSLYISENKEIYLFGVGNNSQAENARLFIYKTRETN
ncbi:MAG: hypothetical protein IPG86_10470 [Chitinophagaceae bacterium]|nr:hypothetical protein [Chitinophagaceae bacterium]